MEKDTNWLKQMANAIYNMPPQANQPPPDPQACGVWFSAAEYAKATINRDISAYMAKMGNPDQYNPFEKAYRKARKKALKNKFKQKP